MKFIEQLENRIKQGRHVVIPDIKCFSPKEGDLLQGRNPVEVAKTLVDAGAPVLSVVTESEQFKGSMELLKSIAEATGVPILRKDFIHTREDLIKTKEYGASAILLMFSCLSREELTRLYYEALELGLDPFVETHTREELRYAAELGVKLVGINNRNILELECDNGDVGTTCALAGEAPKGAILVSESSLASPDDVRSAIRAGADCALVGTAIWKAENTAVFYQMLCSPVSVKICGLQRSEDVQECMNAGIEVLGFVVDYPKPVPWNLKQAEAKDLMRLVTPSYKTCIVTGGKSEDIIRLAMELRPNMVQLHYHETLEDTRVIAESLSEAGIDTIKTVPLGPQEQLLQFGTTELEDIIKRLSETKMSAILVDSREASNASEAGKLINCNMFRRIRQITNKRLILAGGLNTDNIADMLYNTEAEYIDLMTGVELSAGVKDADKIKAIMREASGIARKVRN